jgi:predicted DNA-binding protein
MRTARFTKFICLSLSSERYSSIKNVSDSQGTSMAEVVRDILDDHFEAEEQKLKELQEHLAKNSIPQEPDGMQPPRPSYGDDGMSLEELLRQAEAEKAAEQAAKTVETETRK